MPKRSHAWLARCTRVSVTVIVKGPRTATFKSATEGDGALRRNDGGGEESRGGGGGAQRGCRRSHVMTGGRDWRTVTASQQRTSDVTGARARVGRKWRPPCHSPADQLNNLRYNQRLGQLRRGPAPLTSRVCWEQGQGHPLRSPPLPPSLPVTRTSGILHALVRINKSRITHLSARPVSPVAFTILESGGGGTWGGG